MAARSAIQRLALSPRFPVAGRYCSRNADSGLAHPRVRGLHSSAAAGGKPDFCWTPVNVMCAEHSGFFKQHGLLVHPTTVLL